MIFVRAIDYKIVVDDIITSYVEWWDYIIKSHDTSVNELMVGPFSPHPLARS